MDEKRLKALENRITLLEGTVVKLDRLVYKLFKRLKVPAESRATQAQPKQA